MPRRALRVRVLLAGVLALATLVAPLAGPALAQLIVAGPEFRVNTTTTGNQITPALAMAADGRFVVVWTDASGHDSDSNGVYAQRYAADGTALDIEFKVNTTVAGDQDTAVVAMAPDAHFVVVWQGENEDGFATGIAAQRFAADGTPQGGEIPVNTFTPSFQVLPAIAIAADGRFVIAWTSNNEDGSGDGIFAQRFAANGTPQGGEIPVNTTTAGNQENASVGIASDGRFVVTWLDGSSSLIGRRFAADGTPLTAEFPVSSSSTNIQHDQMTMRDDGRFVVTWDSNTGDGSSQASFFQRFAADGTPIGGQTLANTFTTGDQRAPSLAIAPDGRFVIAWTSVNQGGDPSEGIFAQRFAADGTRTGVEFHVNTYTTSFQRAAAAAMGADGRFVIAWQSADEDGPGFGIVAQRYLVNEPPLVGLSSGGLVYTEDSGPVMVDAAATVQDVDSPNFDGGVLTLALQNRQVEDRLAIRNEGTGSGQIGVSSTTVTYGGVAIGTFGGGPSDATLLITLNSSATPATVQALLRNVTYENTSENPATAARTLSVTLTDGDGETSTPVSRGIAVTVVNDAPVANADSYTINSATLTIAAPGVLANDSDPESQPITAQLVQGPSHGTVQVQASGAFSYTPAASFPGTDSFSYRASDGAASSSPAVVSISGTATGCLPRPRVLPTPSVQGTALVVRVESTPLNGSANNILQQLRFGTFQNARVTLNGQSIISGQTYSPPSGSVFVDFTVERITSGQATTVPFTVVDSCGSWPTFVGGGTAAGF